MSKNKNIKLLLPAVILIWGFLLYKVITVFYTNKIEVAEPMFAKNELPEIFHKDTFNLLPIHRDPFLGSLIKKEAKNIPSKKYVPPKPSVTWPSISYLGTVSDKDALSSIFIVLVDGQQILLQKGQSTNGITLLEGIGEKISLKYKNETKEYTRM